MSLNTEQYFSTIPSADIPRSIFDRSFRHLTVMNVNYFVPIFLDEALPADSFKMKFDVFGRLINPLVCPVSDDLYLETLWFKCPNRLLWSNWVKMCGEQDNPEDSTDYKVPVINSGETGFANMSLADYFGIPTQVANLDVNALPFRMYNKVYNEWLRNENLINSVTVPMTDSDNASNYTLLKSSKPHDYFVSCLPFAQKGDPVTFDLSVDSVPVIGTGKSLGLVNATQTLSLSNGGNGVFMTSNAYDKTVGASVTSGATTANVAYGVTTDKDKSGLIADMSGLGAISVNDLRFMFQLQKKRERDARAGSGRYTEFLQAHFGVKNPDARLQRSEFLGSTRSRVDINSVIQTSSTDSTSPKGSMSAYGIIGNREYAFTTSFTEYSYVMGLARIRHVPIYQQGLHKMWSRSTMLDFYLPVFAHIGEQPVLNKELYAQGKSVTEEDLVTIVDDETFGFQEAWAEYRYRPNMITGKLRSNDSNSLDIWHFAQDFSELPVLNQSFVELDIPIERSIAVSDEPQFLLDFRFDYKCARPMPVRSVPGLIDHF